MNNYKILADSACDIAPDILKKWNVNALTLTFTFNGEDKEYGNGDMPVKEFYDKMRAGGVAKTSAVNMDEFLNAFKSELDAGYDILYIAFSSGLSTTYNSGRMAAEELKSSYPERKILAVDTLSASSGYGLLLKLACDKRDEGCTIDEVACFVENTRLQLCHWFTVDDLVYLKRGGRISPSVAFVGSLLGIKPVLHMDDEGHLISMSKVRGRKSAITALADKVGELAVDSSSGPIYISHGDCREDADLLALMVKEKYGVEVELISDVGPVIGAHSGPGTLAIFFIGRER